VDDRDIERMLWDLRQRLFEREPIYVKKTGFTAKHMIDEVKDFLVKRGADEKWFDCTVELLTQALSKLPALSYVGFAWVGISHVGPCEYTVPKPPEFKEEVKVRPAFIVESVVGLARVGYSRVTPSLWGILVSRAISEIKCYYRIKVPLLIHIPVVPALSVETLYEVAIPLSERLSLSVESPYLLEFIPPPQVVVEIRTTYVAQIPLMERLAGIIESLYLIEFLPPPEVTVSIDSVYEVLLGLAEKLSLSVEALSSLEFLPPPEVTVSIVSSCETILGLAEKLIGEPSTSYLLEFKPPPEVTVTVETLYDVALPITETLTLQTKSVYGVELLPPPMVTCQIDTAYDLYTEPPVSQTCEIEATYSVTVSAP